MAPVAMSSEPAVFNTKRDGHALEDLSDAIDTVNLLKNEMKKERGLYDESEFDKNKDKTQFR